MIIDGRPKEQKGEEPEIYSYNQSDPQISYEWQITED